MIDLDANFIYSPKKGDTRKAPVNVVIHLDGYKQCSAQGCIHWHDPFVNAFSCQGMSINPLTLQAKLIGEVPCVVVDDKMEKEKLKKEKININVPSGLHSRQDVYYVMKQVGKKVGKILNQRRNEFTKHGVVITHF